MTDAHAVLSATFWSARRLAEHGHSRRMIERAIDAGTLVRVRRGRIVAAGLPDDLVRAAQLGGRVDCVSLLRLLGVFVLDAHPLHMQVDIGASRLPRRPPRIVCHWRDSRAPAESLSADVIEALTQACRCQPPRAAIATLDSAWHLGLVDDAGIAEVFSRLPRRFGALRNLLDRRAESGPETLLRLILRGLGCRVDVQVEIDGVGRVDFVVDGWLIIECDSRAHHSDWSQQKRDRRRDVAAAALGYTTIRPIAEDIMSDGAGLAARLRAIITVHNSSTLGAATRGSRRSGA